MTGWLTGAEIERMRSRARDEQARVEPTELGARRLAVARDSLRLADEVNALVEWLDDHCWHGEECPCRQAIPGQFEPRCTCGLVDILYSAGGAEGPPRSERPRSGTLSGFRGPGPGGPFRLRYAPHFVDRLQAFLPHDTELHAELAAGRPTVPPLLIARLEALPQGRRSRERVLAYVALFHEAASQVGVAAYFWRWWEDGVESDEEGALLR